CDPPSSRTSCASRFASCPRAGTAVPRPDAVAGLAHFRETVGIVTGASSGIGAQLARDLAARGMRVALLARRADRLGAVATEIRSAGGEAAVEVCDVAERASVERAVGTVVERWGRVDLLVNSAGYGRHVLFKDHDVADIERMVRTNVLGTVYAIKATLPAMRARGRGWIVNLSSVAGKLGPPDEAAYSATKFAVAGPSEGLFRRMTARARLPVLPDLTR